MLACALLLATAPPATSQTPDGAGPATAAQQLARVMDPPQLGVGPWDRMRALLEVTIFDIDVLTLLIRVDAATGVRLRELTEGRTYSEALADSVARVMLDARDAWAMQTFHRNVGLGRFVGGMTETTDKAADAGFVSRAYAEAFADSVPTLFDFLAEDGAKEGDRVIFRVEGDRVQTLYVSVDGELLLHRDGVSAEGRRAVIPSFFAPGSRFRKRLVESLLQVEGVAADADPFGPDGTRRRP